MRGKGKGQGICCAALIGLALAMPGTASAVTTAPLDSTTSANRSIGKIYSEFASGTTKCTASVVDAPNRSTILTAGHCLTSVAKGPILKATFYPAFHDNVAPFSHWDSAAVLPAPQWAGTDNHRYDYGFIVLARNTAGIPVQDAVGALPIAFNQPRNQSYRIFGYPAEPSPPYDGEKLWACDTGWSGDWTNGPGPGPLVIQAPCDFGVGASGGPWLSGQGAVASVNSNSPLADPNTENGPYLDGDAAALFATAGNISTAPPLVPAPKKKKCKKKKGHKRALPAKKKCKKKHHHH
jgi:hypothetical protein